MILADEDIDFKIIKGLRNAGVEVISVKEKYAGSSDEQVIKLALSLNRIILTEDKDFGEWVFAHKLESFGIIFLRYHFSEWEQIIKVLLSLIREKGMSLYKKFTTVTINKVRIREI